MLEHDEITQRISTSIQENYRVHADPPTGHTISILHTTGHRVKFKYPVSTLKTYNTQDTPHILGTRDEALAYMGVLGTGATGLFITR